MTGSASISSIKGVSIHGVQLNVEREMRDAVTLQRNVRHKPVSAEGRDAFSTIPTFNRTCRSQHTSPGRALIEAIPDCSWNFFEEARDTPCPVMNPDGPVIRRSS